MTCDPVDLAVVLAIQALSAGLLERPAVAKRAEIVALLPPPGEMSGHPLLSLVRPIIAFMDGEGPDALDMINEGIETADSWGQATLLLFRAMLHQNRGELVAMAADMDEASERYRTIGERWGLAMTSMAGGEMLAVLRPGGRGARVVPRGEAAARGARRLSRTRCRPAFG